MSELPDDWEFPDWNYRHKCHEWKRYISEEVAAMWNTFTDDQKRALCRQADEQASLENWD